MNQNDVFRAIFENSPVSLLLTNAKGVILEATPTALKLLGYSEKELIDCNLKEVLPLKPDKANDGNKQTFTSFDDIITTHKITNEFVVQKKDGEQFFAELNLTAFGNDSDKLYIWAIREIQQEKKAIFDLKERVKEQMALLCVTETLFNNNDINTALSECVLHIQHGWQFPEYTVVRIKLNDGSVYASEGFRETEWGLLSEIPNYGTVEVFYTIEVPAYNNSIFLQEEKKLIDGLAKLLNIFLDQLHAIKKLQEKEVLIRKIMSQIPANAYQFEIEENGKLNILFASKGNNEFIYEYNAEELVNNPTKFIFEGDKDRFTESLKEAHKNLTDISVQYRVALKERIQWRWLIAASEKSDNGKIIWYGSSQDITPLVDYIDVLEQIVFDISHVIRRPVTTILGLSDLIENTNITDENIKEIAEKFKIVAAEMDEYTKDLNITYNKKLNNTEYKMKFHILNKRVNLFDRPFL